MNSKIKLTGIKAIGRHGANPGEQDIVQTFFIDVELSIDLARDEIGQTADYREVIILVQRFVEQKHFQLIETIALGLARKIHSLGNIQRVKVIVHKPSAAKSLLLADVAAEAEIVGK